MLFSIIAAVLMALVFWEILWLYLKTPIKKKDIVYMPLWEFYLGAGSYLLGAVLVVLMFWHNEPWGCLAGIIFVVLGIPAMLEQINVKVTKVDKDTFLYRDIWRRTHEYRYEDVVGMWDYGRYTVVFMETGKLRIDHAAKGGIPFLTNLSIKLQVKERKEV